MVSPAFSIITVTYNPGQQLPATAQSLRGQCCHDYEWVVQDGGSTDGSLAWLQAARPDVLVSEPDQGIYDAMNRAIGRARGEWLYFLNAGDEFADSNVLQDVQASLQAHPGADLLYGDVVYVGDRGRRQRRFHWLTRHKLLFGDLCHQATFARRALFERHGLFDASLRWNADFDWFLRVFRGRARLRYLPRNIGLFHDAGSHVQSGALSQSERNAVRARYLPLPLWRVGHLALRVEHRLRRLAGQSI